ncbi:MAG: aspartate kinase [Marinilabiliales bacterium]|nr:MAG: aspartate kinase [Marinilabiliales bacterium]
MSYKVIKFGGSNLQTVNDPGRCAGIAEQYNTPCVIVLSAFYGVTDKLRQAAFEAADSGKLPSGSIEALTDSCFEQIKLNIDDDRVAADTGREVQCLLDRLSDLYRGIHAIGELPPGIHDSILSFGERISAVIFNGVMVSRGLDSVLRLPEHIGLVTDGEFGSSSILLKESAKKVGKHFAGNRYFVVPGFYGVSDEDKITLLGRGGTDYSAAALAYLLDASSLDVWKDVDGFQTGDPKVVADPQTIKLLSYSEAAELSYFGARILHPRTVEPLQPKNIPVRVFNVGSPSGEPATLIGPDPGNGFTSPKSITFSRHFSVLKLKGPGVGIKPGILARAAGIMDAAGVNISSVFTSQTAICFLLQSGDLKKATRAVKVNAPSLISDVETINDIALVALVGEGITKRHGVAARAFQAVAAENINVEIIAAGASTAAIYFVVKENDCNRAVMATHSYFFGNDRQVLLQDHSDLTSVVL